MKSYSARRYAPKTGEFEVVLVRVEKSGLVIADTHGEKLHPFSEFELDLTGQDGDRTCFIHTPSGYSLIASGQELLSEVEHWARDTKLGEEARKAKFEVKTLPVKNTMIILSVILGVVGLCASFYFSFDLWVDMAMKKIPPSLEQSFGEIYLMDDKLDGKSESWQRVDRIGQKLVSHLDNCPYNFTFHIENKDQVNAFALPGGTVIVLSKLLKEAKSDDEIAGVLGHEIGHVINRDSLRRLLHSGGLGLVLGVVFGGVTSNKHVLEDVVPALNQLETLRYSRDQEAAADVTGVKLTVAAGYNSDAVVDFFERFAKEETSIGKPAMFAILSDHPMTDSRIQMIRKETESLRQAMRKGVVPRIDCAQFQASQ